MYYIVKFFVYGLYRKSESYVFPHDTELTFSNLSQFILSNLLLETRLQAMVGLCTVWDSSEVNKTNEVIEFSNLSNVFNCTF